MRDPETGNSKGFAFINFASFDASDASIEAMNGQYLCNRPISVSYAFKREAKGERHGSAAERLLAAQNPLSQADRPHQLFADAPPVMNPMMGVMPPHQPPWNTHGMVVPPPPPPSNPMGHLPPPPVPPVGIPPPPLPPIPPPPLPGIPPPGPPPGMPPQGRMMTPPPSHWPVNQAWRPPPPPPQFPPFPPLPPPS